MDEYGRMTYGMYSGYLSGAAEVVNLQTIFGANVLPPVDPPEQVVEMLEAIRLPSRER